MATVSTNEREWQGEVLGWFRAVIRPPFTDVTQETGVAGQFPDVIFWADRKTADALVSCELKGVETSARDPDLIKNAVEKCENLGINVLVTWNMRDAVVWSVRSGIADTLWYYPQLDVPSTKEWRKREPELQELAATIAQDLAVFLREGRIPPHCHVESTVFIDAIYTTAAAIVPLYKSLLRGDRRRAIQWCVQQGIASDDDFETAARQIVYRLIGQILFYQTLSRVRGDLDPIILDADDKPNTIQTKLRDSFKAARKIDYLAVFKEDYPDKLTVNTAIGARLIRFCNSFAALDLPKMGPDIVGRILEALIPADEKKNLGQYFTEPWLGDLLASGAIPTKDDLVLDPACGTGAILMRAYMFLRHLGRTQHGDLLDTIWGNDIADFPVELAMINLFKLAPTNIANFPRVIKDDLFNLRPGLSIEVPPNKATGGIEKITLKFPTFDAIVANPPYVRYQNVGAWASDVETYRSELFKRYAILDSTSDLLAFVFAHSAELLRVGGRIAFVTSNSWLDAEYGVKLKRFFLQNFKLIAILESRCEAWFENAKVNTVVTLLEKSPNFGTIASGFLPADLRDHETAFVKLKKPVNEIISNPLSDPLRFDKYMHLWAKIEASNDGLDDDQIRVRRRKQQFLFDALMDGGEQ